MSKIDIRGRAMNLMARIQAATAKYDPSYKLKKRGLLNAHDMRWLFPAQEKLMEDLRIERHRVIDLSDAEKQYALRDILCISDVYGNLVKQIKG